MEFSHGKVLKDYRNKNCEVFKYRPIYQLDFLIIELFIHCMEIF